MHIYYLDDNWYQGTKKEEGKEGEKGGEKKRDHIAYELLQQTNRSFKKASGASTRWQLHYYSDNSSK